MAPYILVVQSDRELSDRLCERLRRARYEVKAEAEAAWARRLLPLRAPDAVIVDTQLADGSGFELAGELRADGDTQRVPVFFVASRFRGAAHRAEARRRFAPAEVFATPLDLDSLLARLRAVAPPEGGPDELLEDESRSDDALEIGPDDDEQLELELEPDEAPALPPQSPPPHAPPARLVDTAQRRERRDVEAEARRLEAALPELAGTLDREPFARVLRRIYLDQRTGSLLLERDRVKKIVSFRDGYPVAVRSNVLAECLGQILLANHLIDAATLERSLARMRAERRPQGQILVEMGALSPHALEGALVLQTETKLLEIFGWRRGSYAFAEGREGPAEVGRLDRPPAALILEGTRRYYDRHRQRAALGPFEGRAVAPSRDPLRRLQDMTSDPGEQMFIESLDGRSRLEELLGTTLVPRGRARLLLVALAEAGMIEPADAPAGGLAARGPGPAEPAAAPHPPPFAGPPRGARAGSPERAAPRGAARPETTLVGPPPLSTPTPRPPLAETVMVPFPQDPEALAAASRPLDETVRVPTWRPLAETVVVPSPLAETVVVPAPPRLAETVVMPPPARSGPPPLPQARSGLVAPAPRAPYAAADSRPRAPSADDLLAVLEAQRAQSHFEALGVDESVGAAEIDRAYDALARRYHPDRFRDGAPEVRAVARQVFDRLGEAHATLTNRLRRQRYVEGLARTRALVRAEAIRAGAPHPAAERMYAAGVEHLRARRTREAAEAFRRAVALAPEKANYRGALGWAIFRQAPADPNAVDAGLAELRRAVELDARDPWARISLGRFYAETGWPDLAVAEFEEALRLSPGITEIEDEVRRLKGNS